MSGKLVGAPQLRARLKAIGTVFKPYGRIWADDTAENMRREVPVRTGALRRSLRRKNATAKRATVAGAYWSNFIDAGSKEHDIFARRKPFLVFQAGGSTIFAKRVHKQRIAAKPFKRRAALKALHDNPMSDELKRLWNQAA